MADLIKVLIVEDNPGDVRLIREILGASTGAFEFTDVPTLREALAWLGAHACDLVLLDLGLPDGDGLDNVTRVHQAFPDIPVVVLTGRRDAELGAEALRHHAQDFITKGDLDPSDLYTKILQHAIERKKAEAEMMRIAEELKRSAQVKADFVSMVSHELRTPLTVIREGILLVADGTLGALNPEQANFMKIVERNAERLSRLINDVLDYQKLEAGQLALTISEMDINEVILENLPGLEPLAKKQGLSLRTELAPELPSLKLDRDKIAQVLVNLVGNAVKFMEKGEVVIQTRREGNTVRVSVIDQGIGIKAEDLDKLFQTFSQIKNDGIHKTGGTGLGLVICRKIMDLHRGKIGVESEWDKGSTFYFLLPITERRR